MDALVQPNEKRIDIMESAGRKLVAKFLWKQMAIRWLCCAMPRELDPLADLCCREPLGNETCLGRFPR
jgi:hypothetical protein